MITKTQESQIYIEKTTKLSIVQLKKIAEIQEKCRLSYWSEKDYFDEVASNRSILLIAETDFQIVGFMIVRTSLDTCDLLNFGVLPDFQGKGIGKELFKTLSRELLERNIRQIWLEVRISNIIAINFYIHRDFRLIQTRKNFYTNPIEDALLMMKEISNSTNQKKQFQFEKDKDT